MMHTINITIYIWWWWGEGGNADHGMGTYILPSPHSPGRAHSLLKIFIVSSRLPFKTMNTEERVWPLLNRR